MVSGERYIRLAKEGSWIVIGQVASVLGSLVLVRVLTERLDPTQYGQLALGLTAAGLVNQTVMGGLTAGIGRYYTIAAETSDLYGYLAVSRQMLAYATGVVFIIGVVLIAGLVTLGYSKWVALVVSAIVLSVLTGYNGALSGIQNAARQRAIVAFHGALDAWLKILFAIFALFLLGTSSLAVVLGYAMSSMAVTLSQFFLLRRTISRQKSHPLSDQNWLQRIWKFSFPFSIFGAFTWMQLASDRWALQTYASTHEVGQYAVLFQLGYTPIALISGMAMSFLGPILYQRSGDATDPVRNADVSEIGWRLTIFSLILTSLSFLAALALHEWLFNLLAGPEFRGSSYLLPWVVLAGGIFSSGQMLALQLMSELKSSAMTTVKIVTASIGILFNVVGAKVGGLQGVVCALIVFSAIYLIWMAALARRPLA